MKRTRKLVTVAVLAVAVVVSAITAAYALSANTTETYAYLPEHSVYFYDTAGEYAWASSEVDTLAVAGRRDQGRRNPCVLSGQRHYPSGLHRSCSTAPMA